MAPPKGALSFAPPAPGSPFSFSTQPSFQPSSSNPPTFSFSNSDDFAPKTSPPAQTTPINAMNGEGNVNSDGSEKEQEDASTLYLEPAAWSRREKAKWKATGRTVMAAVSPVEGEVAAWVAKKPASDPNKPPTLTGPRMALPDRTLLFASPHVLSDPLINLYTETYTLFTSLQRIVSSSFRLPSLGAADAWDNKGNLVLDCLLGPPGAETVGHMRRLVMMYIEELAKLRGTPDLGAETKLRFDAVFHIFQLAELLYLPQDGRGDGLLGEELLDWVNDVDPAPDNSLGNEIMQTREPWDHPSFWPYIIRCLLRGFHLPASSFLKTLSNHPHPPISKFASLLSTHLSLFPRSHNTTAYPLDHQFLSAHKSWLARFRAELASSVGGRGRGRSFEDSQWAGWESDFRAVVELMEGKAETILEEAGDWREAMGAWGVLVDVGTRRDDLPGVIKRIVNDIPVDSTILDDAIQSSLCSGNIVKALISCHELDVWLAAHLGDIFDKLAMIPDDEERFETSLRDYFILEYAELLQFNPKYSALWRIICDYLAAAGDEGRNRLHTHILHVSLGFDAKRKNKETESTAMEEAGIESQFRHFTEVREACIELKLDEEWRTISKIMTDRLVRKGDYGLAATMCLQAEDGHALSRIAEKILDAYLDQGEDEFLRLVDTLPPSLLSEAPAALAQLQNDPTSALPFDLSGQMAVSVFASRLTFLSELRDYLLFMSQGARDRAAMRLVNLLTSGIAPAGFWAVLLVESVGLLEDHEILFTSNDSFELLRVLQEVVSSSTFAPNEYLSQLAQYLRRKEGIAGNTKNGTALARRKMEEVRLALARNLARALVVGFDNPF